VFKVIGALSGGEKSRLSLAKLLLKPRQLLLLDEPTNHLDVPSKDELEKALNDYAGAVIFSSHDRFLLDRVATKVVELEDGQCTTAAGPPTARPKASSRSPSPPPKPPPAPPRNAAETLDKPRALGGRAPGPICRQNC
jgi:ATPase subunit of ABC transporter with duplicated ATPase domains